MIRIDILITKTKMCKHGVYVKLFMQHWRNNFLNITSIFLSPIIWNISDNHPIAIKSIYVDIKFMIVRFQNENSITRCFFRNNSDVIVWKTDPNRLIAIHREPVRKIRVVISIMSSLSLFVSIRLHIFRPCQFFLQLL